MVCVGFPPLVHGWFVIHQAVGPQLPLLFFWKEMSINLSTLVPNCAKSNMLGCIYPSVVPDNPFKSLRLLKPGTSGRAARLHMVAFGCSLATQRHITRSGLHQSGQNMGLANRIWALQPQPHHPCGYLIVGILGSPPPDLVCERGTAST